MFKMRWQIVLVAVLLLTLWAGVALGQTSAPAAGAPASEIDQKLTIKQIVDNGGMLMYVLLVMSVLGWAFVIYFFVVLRLSQVVPNEHREEVLAKITAGKLDEAAQDCEARPCAFSDIALVSLDFMRANPKAEPALLKEVLEGEGSRQAASIQARIQYLLDIGVIAPMVGLLGTVFGMIHAFGVVALDLAKAKPMVLAAGVSEALINTAGGLIVGIPAMMLYAYFRGRASQLVSKLESASLELLTTLVGKTQ